MLIACSVSHFLTRSYDYSVHMYTPLKYVSLSKQLNDIKNTFIVICGPGQEEHLEMLKKHPMMNILYISEKAVNKEEGHGTMPRNTVVIMEHKTPEELAAMAAHDVPAEV